MEEDGEGVEDGEGITTGAVGRVMDLLEAVGGAGGVHGEDVRICQP